ncbi:MAG: hypothetical protein RQ869_01610 [Candidatus Nanopusillus sp.]|nr:hypothetical protein [Candidatus Nanopusillus sp.]
MVNNLESIIRSAEYIINNADKLQNPMEYFSVLSKFPHILSKFGARFNEEIERKRIPFKEIKGHIDLDSIIINGCSTIGNIEIARILDYEEKDVSNVVDIVCEDKKTIEQKDRIIKYLEMRKYEYKFLPNNIYGFKLNLNRKEVKIPNLYGIYYYIEVKLPNNTLLYIMIDTAGNITIKKSGLNYTLYFENFGLFSIIYKFFRYKSKDKKDLREYEKYKDRIKEIIDKGFSDRDISNLRRLFSKKDIDKIRKNLDKYIEEYPDSVYKSLYKVIEYI